LQSGLLQAKQGTKMPKITDRIDRITLLTDDYRSPAPPVPKSVKIELTARCDFKCFFCASHMRLREKSDMSWPFFARRTVHVCGLFASSILYDGEQQARMQAAVDEIIPYVDEHCYLPPYGQAGLTSGAKGTRATAGNQGRIGALRKPLPCWSLFTEGHITYDGRLSACCFDHEGRFNMGDLHTTPFRDAWRSAKFQALRRANLAEDVTGTICEKCIAYEDDAQAETSAVPVQFYPIARAVRRLP
jgi:radical SAM protein with 4Fe4S-binding SPASM domain